MTTIRAIVTDIEGTTSALSMLKEVLAPYAREHLAPYLEVHRTRPEVRQALDEARALAREPDADDARVHAILTRWIDEDRKAPPLKTLQGFIWERGYREGALRAHVYPDVLPALRAARERGRKLYVYSSGSVLAQRLFFEYTTAGDVRSLFDDYFDTAIGAKGEPASYTRIAERVGIEPSGLLFLSDAQAELDAAQAAGLTVLGVMREGNRPLHGHTVIASFADIEAALALRMRGLAPDERESIAALAELARFAYSRGWSLATSGNYSVRLGPERVAITASGRDKSRLQTDDVVTVDLHGRPHDLRAAPSAETQLHCSLYRTRPEVGAVGHSHSVAGTVLSRRYCERGVLVLRDFEMAKAIEGVRTHEHALHIPVVPNSQDMGVLEQRLERALGRYPDAPAYLVAGHGLTTWAANLPVLRRQLEALEFLLSSALADESIAIERPE